MGGFFWRIFHHEEVVIFIGFFQQLEVQKLRPEGEISFLGGSSLIWYDNLAWEIGHGDQQFPFLQIVEIVRLFITEERRLMGWENGNWSTEYLAILKKCFRVWSRTEHGSKDRCSSLDRVLE